MSQHAPQLIIFTNRRYVTPNVAPTKFLKKMKKKKGGGGGGKGSPARRLSCKGNCEGAAFGNKVRTARETDIYAYCRYALEFGHERA